MKEWKYFHKCECGLNEDLNDEAFYLVTYLLSDGSFGIPHRAYWVEEEEKFYSSENNNSHPIYVDFYIKMPATPPIKLK